MILYEDLESLINQSPIDEEEIKYIQARATVALVLNLEGIDGNLDSISASLESIADSLKSLGEEKMNK